MSEEYFRAADNPQTLRVSPQSPSPAILSILVISGSAAMSALHARSIATLKAAGSGDLSSFVPFCWGVEDVVGPDKNLAFGTGEELEDHFHPGDSVGSSSSDRRRSN